MYTVLITINIMLVILLFFFLKTLSEEHRKEERAKEDICSLNKMVQTYDIWLKKNKEGYNVAECLLENGYKKIAVYGLGRIGKSLIEEIEVSNAQLVYVVDKKMGKTRYKNIDCFGIDEELPYADLLIISLPGYSNDIKKDIKRITGNIKFVKSIQEVLYAI